MQTFSEHLGNERKHLDTPPSRDEKPLGMGTVRFVARSHGNSRQIIDRARAVLKIVNEHSAGAWPSDPKWRELLPAWFVSRSAPERTQEEIAAETAQWRNLSDAEKQRWENERQWSVADWTYWLEPKNREWFWWDAVPLDENTAAVSVEVRGWPFPWESLAWLLRAAGADSVDAEK